jgi:uncharacterized protein DUF3142
VLIAEPAQGDLAVTLLPIDRGALAEAHRPVTLVVRIDGARPIAGLVLAPVIAAAVELRTAGVAVAGIEIDHDCATARLGEYAAWLRERRPPRDLRFSITALPTWAGSGALADVAAAVDELVVQVHAIRAPTIFDRARAQADLRAFAAAVPNAVLRVALPTYRVRIGERWMEADVGDVRAFVDDLVRAPLANVAGIVWFRLPVAGDADTWTAETFAGVLERRGYAPPEVRVTLQARGGDRFDVIASNPLARAAELPAVQIDGELDEVELVSGYTEDRRRHFRAPHRRLPAGATQTIGWVRGKAPHVAID